MAYVMPSALSRLQTRVPPAVFERAKAKAKANGKTVSDYLADLVRADLDGHQDYMVKLIGHRLMIVSVMMTAMLKSEVSEEEFVRIRALASHLGAGAFGPLPPQPFELPEDLAALESIKALHEVLSHV
ncbi:hypothetical protein [Brevundimonas nasdae]|uniref:hypothetical protein n=1 Tax=Brevundimonas nasdae TaxID=172043 RepID=UPI003F68F032